MYASIFTSCYVALAAAAYHKHREGQRALEAYQDRNTARAAKATQAAADSRRKAATGEWTAKSFNRLHGAPEPRDRAFYAGKVNVWANIDLPNGGYGR